MIEQRPLAELANDRRFPPDPQFGLIYAALAAGNSQGCYWHAATWSSCWDQANNVLYLAGERALDQAEFNQHWLQTVVPAMPARHVIKLRLLRNSQLELSDLLSPYQAQPSSSYFFRDQEQALVNSPLASQFALHQLDAELLQLPSAQPIIQEISWMWPSLERFLANGLGLAICVEQTIVAWCTAEYLSAQRCGLGIETLEAYQKQGLGFHLASAMLAACRQRGLQAHWECSSKNLASYRLAQKLGLQQQPGLISYGLVWL
ncbi:GNAT family N-acetyltransferase [Herpetosiphon giganteus]|uniref:GNAT family N-acetyltransferase n=1 Tax=Herpetosiphon giganteus TaxID=2029754 RepID=UPI001959DC4A|nr:GNAT family N-acetyltransferase [Herpetosiphon giganteus]MBM7843599.1 RimJ/RimL family protein N-acetyltransferase [Herpetosiphon giganteus]